MDANTHQLLTDLANKLGTTADKMFSVLVKQAKINSIISIFEYLAVILFGVILFKLHKKFSKDKSYSDWDKGDCYVMPMIIGAVLFVVLCVASLFDLGDCITGFLNPEYWALNKIIGVVN